MLASLWQLKIMLAYFSLKISLVKIVTVNQCPFRWTVPYLNELLLKLYFFSLGSKDLLAFSVYQVSSPSNQSCHMINYEKVITSNGKSSFTIGHLTRSRTAMAAKCVLTAKVISL